MTEQEIKKDIQQAITAFGKNDAVTASEKLLNTLGYKSTKKADVNLDSLRKRAAERNLTDVSYAMWNEWKNARLIFQYSDDEVKRQNSLFEVGYNDSIQSYLFFAIELTQKEYTRSQISNITRFINRLYEIPVMIFFRYSNLLTVSVINRRLHKKDSGKDVLEKVTQIKDIDIVSTHRAHIEILFDISFSNLKIKYQFSDFEELHNAWQKTLDTKLLNKKFFEELSNWYFWAHKFVEFPNDIKLDEDKNIQINLIRLITRLIFVWFLREKRLIHDDLFDKREVKRFLKSFDSESERSKNYYTAILQNLFFATLNQSMEKRNFADDADEFYKDDHGVKNLYRYADQFTIGKREIINLFKDIPFLNGGLFDCLDKENEDTGKIEYIDGFSRNPKKVPSVPDLLFFGKERTLDLSEDYGYKRNKEKCRGLLEIFNDYKFTIEENTPIDEEVALDPELLGKVFENLLAYYIPETETTARKQTGSFYTPREIVNYMVDESLFTYLRTQMLEEKPGWLQLGNLQSEIFGNEIRKGQLKLEHRISKNQWHDQQEQLDDNLRKLIAYSNDEHPFSNEDDIQHLIYAIDHCKILDPACGSGAFPMGILHKLVYILTKLDDNNIRWRELQKRKAQNEVDQALNENDKKERENKLIDINNSFEDNASDYGRKLYLIENCIYGVDKQPIAVQISKLRFFISLIVDQKENKGENRGIRPLPNLETKFVAADTLVGLEKPKQSVIMPTTFYDLLKEFEDIRHKHFDAKTRKEKRNCQIKDKIIRKKIALLLKESGWNSRDANKIAEFDLYDQNVSASWFEPEWMFGKRLSHGFDIVIGNPPYHQLSKDDTASESYRQYLKNRYKTSGGRLNTFIFFMHQGLQLLNRTGNLIYIIPNTLLTQEYYRDTRKYLLENSRISQIVHYPTMQFENAIVENITIQYEKSKIQSHTKLFIQNQNEIELKGQFDFIKNAKAPNFSFNLSENLLLDEIDKQDNILLSDLCDINQAIALKGDKSLSLKYSNLKGKYYKLLDGRNINKYKIKWDGVYLDFNLDMIHSCKRKDIFETDEKLLFRRVSSSLVFTYDNAQYFALNTIVVVNKKNERTDLKFLLGLLNSSFINYYYREKFKSTKTVFSEIQARSVGKLPIPKLHNKTISTIASYLILLGKSEIGHASFSFFQRLIDTIVYELYLPEVIRKANCEVLKHLISMPELTGNKDEMNLKTIEKIYKELSHPTHPISSAMLRMLNIEEINIIEGRK